MKRADIEQLLPEIFQRTLPPDDREDNPLRAFLSVMEMLHAPSEAILADLSRYFDPYRTPERFVAYLASWVDLDQVWIEDAGRYRDRADSLPPFPAGTGRLREVIMAAPQLIKWRGTAHGLRLFLETATGVAGFAIDEDVIDDDGRPIPFHIRVGVPDAAAVYEPMIRRIIEIEKPVYVTYELATASQ